MNPLIIIPTFVTAGMQANAHAPVTQRYDHPNLVGHTGNLSRCLASLSQLSNVGMIAVLVAGEKKIALQAASKVQGAVENFPMLRVMVVGPIEEALVQQRIKQLNVGNLEFEVGLSGYSAVRNLGLVIACTLGFDSVVFLDDDEVIDDPDFLTKGMYGLGKLTRHGIPILAKTGYYLNARGTYHSMSKSKWYNHYWRQGEAFNKWIDKAMAGPRLMRSNHVCGGCLAMHHAVFTRLAFDPWIARGEDLDYMLNLRMYGSDIWFDNQWRLRHLPPRQRSEGLRFRQDIFRWLYEYRKMEFSRTQIDLQQVKPKSLEPYPGPFLEPGITKRIKRTALLRSIGRPDKKGYRAAVRAATHEASTYAEENCEKYFEFQHVWPTLMQRIENDQTLQTWLYQAINVHLPRGEQPVTQAPAANIDPGKTSEIRLNLDD